MCAGFFVIVRTFDVCMLLEVVWNFVLLLCTLLFAWQFCVLAVNDELASS